MDEAGGRNSLDGYQERGVGGGKGGCREDGPQTTYRAVLAIGEFRALWAADVLSIAGDQFARVALAVVVFTRTDSAILTGLTYALTFVPAFVGGLVLSGLGDRYPRRNVMVVTDLVRGVLVAVMAVPGLPLWVLCGLVAVMTLLAGPFKAAQQALLPDVLPGAAYETGTALRSVTGQTAQLVGFAGGGTIIAVINPSLALLLDAATFLLSAIILRTWLSPRPAVTTADDTIATTTTGGTITTAGKVNPATTTDDPVDAAVDAVADAAAAVGVTSAAIGRGRRATTPPVGHRRRASLADSMVTGVRTVWADPGLRALLGLLWLAAFYITPEAIAAPYASQLGGGAVTTGLLMASDPAGSIVGGLILGSRFGQMPPRLLGLLGIGAGIPLIFTAFTPPLVVSMLLFAVSGMFATGYTIRGNTTYTRRLPDQIRAQGSGIMSAGLITVQGLGALAAGVAADHLSPAHAITLAGIVGVAVAIPTAITCARTL